MMVAHGTSSGESRLVADIITEKRDEIAALCRKYRVGRLYLFGSAATGLWNSETGDVDLLVDLGEYEAGITYRYLDFADELESLLGRHVDLVTTGGLRRRSLLREEIERSKVQLYAARDTNTVTVMQPF